MEKSVVLFVDDDTSLLSGIRDALRREPYRIETASSPAAAFGILAAGAVDVVVSDERMPGMSGSEFLSQVRQQYPEKIRIMLTGETNLDAAIRAINRGEVYRFLTKPCSPVELACTVRDALLLRSLSRESSRLLATARRQRSVLECLERDHPGITRLDRSDDGSIVLELPNEDAPSLVEALRHELERCDRPTRQVSEAQRDEITLDSQG